MSPAFGFSPELNSKRLEILKDAFPKLARVGLLGPDAGGNRPTERAAAAARGTEAEIGGDLETTRRQRFRERLSNRKAEAGDAIMMIADYPLFRRESGSSSLPANTGCRLFTSDKGVCR